MARGHRRKADRHACPGTNRSPPGHQEHAERGGEKGDDPQERGDPEVEGLAHEVHNPETPGHLISERLDRDESEQFAVPEALRDAKRGWGRRGGDHSGRTDVSYSTKRLRC